MLRKPVSLLSVSLLLQTVAAFSAGQIAEESPTTMSAVGEGPKLTLGATVIYVEDDVKQVLDFYVEAFGLTLRYYDGGLRFGELETGSAPIMIASYEAGEFMVGESFKRSEAKRPSDVEIAFLTADVPAAYARAIAAGARPARAPKTFSWGQTAAYVYSIEGTLVGILTPPPLATQSLSNE